MKLERKYNETVSKYDEMGVQFLLANSGWGGVWGSGLLGVEVRGLGGRRVRSEGTPRRPHLQ